MKKRPEWQNKPLKINKKQKWALLFKFNKQGDRAEYYLKPVSELTGEKKETFLTLAQRVNDVPSHWKDRFKVNMYYYSEKLMRGESEFYYLFVGDESNLKRVKEEFIKDNSVDTEFEPMLSDMVKPETRRHFEGILESQNIKDRSWVLVFNNRGYRSSYYLKPIADLSEKQKRDFDKMVTKKYKEFGTIWEDEYDVDMYYFQDEGDVVWRERVYTHLFIGSRDNLQMLRDDFIKRNSNQVDFSPELSEMLKPKTRKHFGDIMDNI